MLLPIALNVENRPVLIVGGGHVALRKAKAFLECGAWITVVAPQLIPDFPPVEYRPKTYESSDLNGFVLVLACTDSREINGDVASDALKLGILCNVADAPDESAFHTVATVRRGEIAVGVSTGGISPVLAGFVRQRIDEALPKELEILLEMARSYDIPTKIRGDFWRQLLESEILTLLREDNSEEATLLFESLFHEAMHEAEIQSPEARVQKPE